MHISQILRSKRSDVVTTSPATTVRAAISIMTREHVGALLVVDGDQRLLGVISERDIIHSLDSKGNDLMNAAVNAAIKRPDIVKLWTGQGAAAMSMTPEEFDKFLRGDILKWADVVKKFPDKPQ